MGGGKHETGDGPTDVRDQRRAITVGRVHDRPQVVHPGVEGWQRLDSDGIGEAHAATVEQDQPAERRQAPPKVGQRGHIPLTIHVAEPHVRQDDVNGPLAEHLVRDVNVAGTRVAGFRGHGCRISPGAVSAVNRSGSSVPT